MCGAASILPSSHVRSNRLQAQHPILRAHGRYGKVVFRNLPPFAYRQPWFDTEGTTEVPLQVVTDPAPEAWRAVLAKDLRTPIGRGKHPRLRVTAWCALRRMPSRRTSSFAPTTPPSMRNRAT